MSSLEKPACLLTFLPHLNNLTSRGLIITWWILNLSSGQRGGRLVFWNLTLLQSLVSFTRICGTAGFPWPRAGYIYLEGCSSSACCKELWNYVLLGLFHDCTRLRPPATLHELSQADDGVKQTIEGQISENKNSALLKLYLTCGFFLFFFIFTQHIPTLWCDNEQL